ncbi:serine hydrolase domain-containing protein [Rhizomicrobium electricum]|uniref:Serine hydrolase domain-containing protein n=1 Tax=Rhizomicrobium electricum TaxID=480070 RepID=A0ABP3P3C3_9PROT|nr:serine hydrolase domain-containing protein [Rhizomicrobium electricum]NIJ47590.1 CubicO group peptidase (beta-lactamase class C family) [Rhizomicrobium electricum]
MRPAIVFAALLFAAPAVANDLNATAAAALTGTGAPGLAVLTMQGGKIAGEGVSGLKRSDGTEKLGPADVWHIGSDGKPITATLIAKLVDQGKLSWDAKLEQMLPELAATMRPEYRDVTLVDLLSHRAGLPHDISDMTYFNTFYGDKRPLSEQRLAYVARALTEAPEVPPHTKFNYSNTGFLLAAVIAERVTGTDFETLMRREVFQPLGMASAGFGNTRAGQNSGHLKGKPATDKDANPAMFAPAGNMYMTMRDWAAFCLDQMAGVHGKGKLLKPATYRKMQTPVATGERAGIAWGTLESVAGVKGPALTHSGSDGNWYALVILFPETQNGALTAANAGEEMGGDKATKAALKAVLPGLAPPVTP